jgi:hypothetical protein
VAVQASRQLLAEVPNTTVVPADLRDPKAVLTHPETRALLDTDQPIALMLVSVLHFVSDHDIARDVVRRYVDAMSPGSYLVISHVSDPVLMAHGREDPAAARAALEVYQRSSNPVTWRTLDQVESLFDGLELVEPGITHVLDWHPDDDRSLDAYRDRIGVHVGVARRP